MRITLPVSIDLDLSDALTEAIHEADLTGLGADGASEYEVGDVTLEGDDLTARLEIEITIEVERIEGKFAPKDELAEAISAALADVDLSDAVGVEVQ